MPRDVAHVLYVDVEKHLYFRIWLDVCMGTVYPIRLSFSQQTVKKHFWMKFEPFLGTSFGEIIVFR